MTGYKTEKQHKRQESSAVTSIHSQSAEFFGVAYDSKDLPYLKLNQNSTHKDACI